MTDTPPRIPDLAIWYRCHRRTLERMRAEGVDVSDPKEVFLHLSSQRQQSLPMLERLAAILDELEH